MNPSKFKPTSPTAIVLNNPKYAHNVGAVLRIASCFKVGHVVYTGQRIQAELDERKRLPREERMKGYRDVELIAYDYPLDLFVGYTPIAVELREGSEKLTNFEHPKNAVYVFGPEDGSVEKGLLVKCHRFIVIPSVHCLNLSNAVAITMYDRILKREFLDGLPELGEQRGYNETDDEVLYDHTGSDHH